MAIKYSDIKAVVENPNFDDKELAAIANVEKFIDDRITNRFDNDSIYFDIQIIRFEKVSDRGADLNFKDTRKKLMTKELERRFTEAEWEISYDEENFYWIIKGKK